MDSVRIFPVTATLHIETEHLQMWVENGVPIDLEALKRSATTFEQRIYPTNHRYFGQEWSPGIDGDPRLVVLNACIQGAAGYFAYANEYPRWVNPHSNQHEMFVMNLNALSPGTSAYDAVLAHEFQHMIHWNLDRNEETWLNEGASELAEDLNGFGAPTRRLHRFAQEPDVQLNTWTDNPSELAAHYAASYLIMRYFLNRFGEHYLRTLVQSPQNGIASFDAVLAQALPQQNFTFDDLFADWLIANILDDPLTDGPRYGYPQIDLKIQASQIFTYPYSYEGQVHQYAADYFELLPPPQRPITLQIRFTGAKTVKLVPNTPTSGRFQWWSGRGDAGHAYLERSFDLSQVSTAALSFNIWYDIEPGWDYAYIRVSTNGGKSWEILRTAKMSTYNPNGNAFAPGYTGKSGVPLAKTETQPPKWVQETLDLGRFCGQKILLRFDYVTDEAVNKAGLCLDDFYLESIGFQDDVEKGDRAKGFLRIDNCLPQRYLVQLIELNGDTFRIHRLPINTAGEGIAQIKDLGGHVKRALLIVSAITPGTTETAPYHLHLEEFP